MQRAFVAMIAFVLCLFVSTLSAEARGHSRRHHHIRYVHHSHRLMEPEHVDQGEQSGLASYYHEGQRVACGGERFDPNGLTAAHRSLPCGTMVEVTNTRNGKTVTVQINDRGPAKWTYRIIDLSRGAARAIDMVKAGVVPVTVEVQ